MGIHKTLPKYGSARTRVLQECVDASAKYDNLRDASKELGIPYETLRSRLSMASVEGIMPTSQKRVASGFSAPFGKATKQQLLRISGEHKMLGLFDVHVPYHDKLALDAAVNDGIREGCDIVLLGGDFMDCISVSFWERRVDQRDLAAEIEDGQQMLKLLKGAFPSARFIYKEGNHERRLPRFIHQKVPELAKLPGLNMSSLLQLQGLGIEWADEDVKIRAGKLDILHGDEYPGGGVHIARIKYLKAQSNIMFGHHHVTDDHTHRTYRDDTRMSAAVGCLCDLYPVYVKGNNWNHGHSITELYSDGDFYIRSKRITKGKVF